MNRTPLIRRARSVAAIATAGATILAGISLSSAASAASVDDRRFDFGPGAVAEGYVGVGADALYSLESGFGFGDTALVSGTDRGGDPVRGDFVTVGATNFSIDLPDADYEVAVIAGDAAAASEIQITAESIPKVLLTAKPAGQFLEMTFPISLVDGRLDLVFGGSAAAINSLVITRVADREAAETPTAYLAGDSTVQTYTADYAPQAGWGQMLDRFLDDEVVVSNAAIGGHSSKNFISQGRLDEILRVIRPDDYLFVQFGHNDATQGVDDRYASPADYKEYLRVYVDGARERGAIPVIVTPVARRQFGADGVLTPAFPEYVAKAIELATEEEVDLVDLSGASVAYLQEVGAEASKSIFLHVEPGLYPGRPTGTADDTHFQEYGALQMARLVAQGVAQLDIPLAENVEEAEAPAEVPASPTGLLAGAVSNAGAQLRWTAVDGADLYRVSRATGTSDDWALVGTTTVAQLAATGLVEGQSYRFRVTAVNDRGESLPSSEVTVSTKSALFRFDAQPVGAPVQPGYTELNRTMQYTAARGWGFREIAGLNDRDRGSATGANPLQRDFVLGTPEFMIDLPNGSYSVTTHSGDWIGSSRTSFTMEGRDVGSGNAGTASVAVKVSSPIEVTDGQLNIVVGGTGARLNGIEITPLLLAPSELVVTDLTIAQTGTTVGLGWTGTDDAVAYRVSRRDTAGGDPVVLGEVVDARFTDTTALVGVEYDYSVVAVDATGAVSIASAAVTVSIIDPAVSPLSPPSRVVVEDVQKQSVSLAWSPVSGALGYAVFRAPSADGDFRMIARTTDAAYVDTSVVTTVPYSYRVASVNAGGVSAQSDAVTSAAPTSLVREAEYLDRAPVAIETADGVYVGWRMLGLDPDSIGFHVTRDGKRITKKPITGSTNLVDPAGTKSSTYRVIRVLGGIQRDATEDFGVWSAGPGGGGQSQIPLDTPADGYTKDGQPFTYTAGDGTVGDLDGDGEYEIVMLWSPSNSKDNSQAGYTGEVFVDAYRLDGTRLWRIGMGPNIRAGAHYTQLQVFDYDGDGAAEVIVKTADGTVDGAGARIGDTTDYRNSSGYILTGPEFLTLFDGATGAAQHTVAYVPPRGDVGSWGDTYGNRVDRFLAGTAYLDGEHPSAIFSRGYYTRTVISTWDVVDDRLVERWTFDSNAPEYGDAFTGQGNHNLSVADVDGDQKDEIVFGSMTIDDDGTPLYNTGLGHGDALHVSDLDPTRPGLEVVAAHEDMGKSGNTGATFRDAATGEVLARIPAARDTGRAAAADIDASSPGAEWWAIGGDAAWNSRVGEIRAADGSLLGTDIPAANHLAWWDGDLLREIVDHDWDVTTSQGVPTIAKWDPDAGTADVLLRDPDARTNNSTKGSPVLQADLYGDWREEVIWRSADSSHLIVNSTAIPTEVRLRTLMHDPVYRLGVAWQNTSYNQPPHTGYFLGVGMAEPAAPSIRYQGDHLDSDGATAVPARGVLSSDSGHESGLHDGRFAITMNLWWGENASEFRLYENGSLIETVPLVANGTAAQTAVVRVSRPDGDYRYTGELVNSKGITPTADVRVVVNAATPAVPVLSHDNWDGDGGFTVTSDLWWGTNASRWRLLENGEVIDAGVLVAATPAAQRTVSAIAGRAPGTYEYRIEYENLAGVTTSAPVTVTVR